MIRNRYRFALFSACLCTWLGCSKSTPAAPPRPAATQASPQANVAPAPAAHQANAAPSPPPAAPPSIEDLKLHGAELYKRMCAVCHGEQGEGYKADHAPALGNQAFLASVTDMFLMQAIADGRKGTQMSAWFVQRGGPLSQQDVIALSVFIRSWQQQPHSALDEDAARGDHVQGKQLFARHCERCHGPKAPYVHILDRELLSQASIGFLRRAIREGRPPTPMVGFAKTLGDKGVEDVVAYLRSLPSWPSISEPDAASRPPPLPLGPVPRNPRGREPVGFLNFPLRTPTAIVAREYDKKARMVLLDARVPSDYSSEHVAGAVSVPFYDPSPYLAKLPKHTWLVCYCGCPHAESGILAEKLHAAGFDKVTILDEGLGEWKAKGHPMRTGSEP